MSRLEFKAKTKREAFVRSNGICECALIPFLNRPQGCGQPLRDGRIRYEHIIPDNIAQDNSLDNCAVLTVACWREKTDSYDRKVIAKSNHVRDRARGIKQKSPRSFQTNRNSPFKKRMDGTVVRRNQTVSTG